MSNTRNLGRAGSALDPTSGANDPLLLTHTGENYVYLPGVAANYLSTVDAAALTPTGDMEIVMRVKYDALGTNQSLIVKYGASGQFGYRLYKTSADVLQLTISSDGTTTAGYNSTSLSAAGVSAGAWHWIKITLDLTNGANSVCTFYVSLDTGTAEPTSWTLVNQVLAAVQSPIFDNTAVLELGMYAGVTWGLDGAFSNVNLRNGIAGTDFFAVDLADVNDYVTSFTATTGQTVTVNRAATGRKTALVTRPVWLFGTDDYLEVADNALLDFGASDEFTLLAIYRQWATVSAGDEVIISKNADTYGVGTAGYALYDRGGASNAHNFRTSDTATTATNTLAYGTLGELDSVAAVMTATQQQLVKPGASSSVIARPAGSLENSVVFRLGRTASAGGGYFEGELMAVAVWPRALDAAEIALVDAYLRAYA